jgi:hypothetical protein
VTYGIFVTIALIGFVGLLFGSGLMSLWYHRHPTCVLQPIRLRVVARPSRIDWERLEAARDPAQLPIGTKVVRK